MRLVGAFLLVEAALAIAAWTRRLVLAILAPEALHRCPRLDKRAIDREVIVRQELLHLGLVQHRAEELRRHISLQKPLAVLGEYRNVPDRRVHRQPDEPAKQQIVIEL